MKKAVKVVSLILVVCLLAGTLSGCGLSESKVEGIWSGSWKEDDATINYSIVFAPNGSYSLTVNRNYKPSVSAFGAYKIQGSKVVTNGLDGTTVYSYSFGSLHVDGHALKKSD